MFIHVGFKLVKQLFHLPGNVLVMPDNVAAKIRMNGADLPACIIQDPVALVP